MRHSTHSDHAPLEYIALHSIVLQCTVYSDGVGWWRGYAKGKENVVANFLQNLSPMLQFKTDRYLYFITTTTRGLSHGEFDRMPGRKRCNLRSEQPNSYPNVRT